MICRTSPPFAVGSLVIAHFGSDVALGFTDQLITTAFVCLAGVSCPINYPF